MTETTLRRVALVVNDSARSAGDLRAELRGKLERLVEVVDVEGPDPAATTRAVARCRDQVDAVIAAGGDGTLHHVVRGLAGSPTPLAVLPLGTANDFARSLSIPADLDQALEVALTGDEVDVDLGCANGIPYLNAAGVGVVEDITRELSTGNKKLLGPVAYAYAAARTCLGAEPFEVELEIDGLRDSRRVLQILVGNGRFFGPALEVAPGASVEDGLLHLCYVEPSSSLELVAAAIHLLRGSHDRARGLEITTARRVRIETGEKRPVYADGERIERTPVTIEVVDRSLRVRVPPRDDPERGAA